MGPLVCKVKDHQVEFIVDTLCNNMIGDNEQLRDISSIGLKTVINELPLTTQTLAATGKKNREIKEFLLKQNEVVVDQLGWEIDRIETNLKSKYKIR